MHNETPFNKIIDCSLTSLENYKMERWVRGFMLKNVQWPNRLNTPELREKKCNKHRREGTFTIPRKTHRAFMILK